MAEYSARARERALKAQEVILRMYSKRLTFWQAANIPRISPRHLRRILRRYQERPFGALYCTSMPEHTPGWAQEVSRSDRVAGRRHQRCLLSARNSPHRSFAGQTLIQVEGCASN
jgi:hypothetical protein